MQISKGKIWHHWKPASFQVQIISFTSSIFLSFLQRTFVHFFSSKFLLFNIFSHSTSQEKGDGEGFGWFEVDRHFVGRTGGNDPLLSLRQSFDGFLQTAREREERLEKQYEEFMKSDESKKEVGEFDDFVAQFSFYPLFNSTSVFFFSF